MADTAKRPRRSAPRKSTVGRAAADARKATSFSRGAGDGRAIRRDDAHASAPANPLAQDLAAIVELSPDGIVTFDERGAAYANPAFTRLTGIAGETLRALDAARFDALLGGLADPAQPIASFATLGRDASDVLHLVRPRRATLERTVRERRNRDGSRAGWIVYLRDATQEAETEQRRNEFLSTAAHELRTPMASIHGFAELLLAREFDAATRRDLLATIHAQSSLVTELLNELLDLARIEAHAGRDFRLRAVPLLPMVQETLASLHIPNDPRPVALADARGLPDVHADPEKFGRALANVLANAYKYSPNGGTIGIAFRTRRAAAGREVGVVVRDEGIGMTPAEAARACERFYRTEAASAIPGTGLGLALVHEIVQRHGGCVAIDSAPGKGTAVTLWLRAAASPRKRGARSRDAR